MDYAKEFPPCFSAPLPPGTEKSRYFLTSSPSFERSFLGVLIPLHTGYTHKVASGPISYILYSRVRENLG